MIRAVAWPVTLLTTAMVALAADESRQSKSEVRGALDMEAPILKQNRSDEPLPAGGTPDAKVARLEKQLGRAKGNAAGAERLWKIGVLAKVEVEQRLLKVVRCESDLANASVARAKEDVAAQTAKLTDGDRPTAAL